ncbi:hypothetical protein [Aeromicrobium sp. UC242_57]|uniref:hypothetical protein n=1 Tax=Aeromicrobium sp. UC242_57 TaxID=3374624 RepID=UPI0037B7126C
MAEIAKKTGVDSFDAAALKGFLTDVKDFPTFMGQPLSREYATKAAPAMIRPQIQILQFQDGELKTLKEWFNPYEGLS